MTRTGERETSTSQGAVHWTEADGDKNLQRGRLLAEVLKAPGRTAAEVAEAMGVALYAPSRRLPELREAGRLRNGRSRPCRVTRRLSLTWFPAREGGGAGAPR
mgnify:FL=1